MKLIVSPEAQKTLDEIEPQRQADRLIEKAEAFAQDPFGSHPFASRLKGEPDRVRLRQGDHRAILLVVRAEDTVIMERVGHRREVYR